MWLTLQVPFPQNGQTHSNNSPTIFDELLESAWPFCGVGILKVKVFQQQISSV